MKKRLPRSRKLYIISAAITLTLAIPLATSAIKNINLAETRIVDIQLGSTPIDQVYLGSKLIWERLYVPMQEFTYENCPAERTVAIDARDNKTYWIQRMPDDKCWMLTNLAYAGGGANTYGDVKEVLLQEEGSFLSYDRPNYIPPFGANPTLYPNLPSESTTGIGQYGYLYNFCAASGNQRNTAACLNAAYPPHDPAISICPKGWRLPVGSSSVTAPENDFAVLNSALNNGTQVRTDDTQLRTIWLAMYSGAWADGVDAGLKLIGEAGLLWTSTIISSFPYYAQFTSSSVTPGTSNNIKHSGFSVRCLIGEPT